MSFFKKLLGTSDHNQRDLVSRKAGANQQALVKNEDFEDRKSKAVEELGNIRIRHGYNDEIETLEDKIRRHRSGEIFKYAVIATSPPANRGLLLSRLRTAKLPDDVHDVSLDQLPPIDIIDNYCEFKVSLALGLNKKSKLPPYTLVSSILVHYVPMDTFLAVSCPLRLSLVDHRKKADQTVREYELSDKGAYNILFTMDYSMRTDDLPDLVLTAACNQQTFKKGKAWGAMKIVAKLSHMDFPQKANLEEVIGVSVWAHSDLEEHMTNPTKQSGLITSEAFKLMKEAYKRGEIEDVMAARDNKMSMNVAKTVVGSALPNVPVSQGMDLMARMMEDPHEVKTRNPHQKGVSIGSATRMSGETFMDRPTTREGNGGQFPKSAMKKQNPFEVGRALMAEEEESRNSSPRIRSLASCESTEDLGNLSGEVGPEDSFSNASSSNEVAGIRGGPEFLSKIANDKFESI